MSKIIAKKRVFTGNVVRVDQIKLNFGAENQPVFELVTFNVETGVSALPLVNPDTLMLIRHYQLGIDGIGWSLPTGGLNSGEDPTQRMQQELQEEIGFKAGKLTLLSRIHTLPGYVGTKPGYVYLAEDLKPSKLDGDEQYPIETVTLKLPDALQYIRDGRILDGRTMFSILYYHTYIYGRS
jgi:ADP-ribose diphosphatase